MRGRCEPNTWIRNVIDATAYTVGLSEPRWTGAVYRLGSTTLSECCEYCRAETYCQVGLQPSICPRGVVTR